MYMYYNLHAIACNILLLILLFCWIRKKGRTGYCPATVIRRVMDVSERSRSPTTSAESISFESEKRIYEVLNIHKPPPRRLV